jgi:hypothetical protein
MSQSAMSKCDEDVLEPLNLDKRRLVKLYHAAHCDYDGAGDCLEERYCCASKRLFQHMITCTTDCAVPGCKKCRGIWKHYRKCQDTVTCPLCSAVPTAYSGKALSARFKKSAQSSQTTTASTDAGISLGVMTGGPEENRDRPNRKLVTPNKENLAGDINARRQIMLMEEEGPEISTRRPPLSPRKPTWAIF